MRTFLIALAVALFAIAGIQGVAQLAAAAHNSCRIHGDAPEGARVSESNSAVLEHPSFWPLGSVCDWPRADGKEGNIHSYVGSFPSTLMTYGLLIGSFTSAGMALALRPTTRRERASR